MKKNKLINLRVSEDSYAKYMDLAKAKGIKLSELIRQLLDMEDDERKVHQAIKNKEFEGICNKCNKVTSATIGHIEKWINISNEEDVQYELVYKCKECNEICGRIQIFNTNIEQ